MEKKGQKIIDGVFLMTGPFVSQIRLKIKFTPILLVPEIHCQLYSPFINLWLRDLCGGIVLIKLCFHVKICTETVVMFVWSGWLVGSGLPFNLKGLVTNTTWRKWKALVICSNSPHVCISLHVISCVCLVKQRHSSFTWKKSFRQHMLSRLCNMVESSEQS